MRNSAPAGQAGQELNLVPQKPKYSKKFNRRNHFKTLEDIASKWVDHSYYETKDQAYHALTKEGAMNIPSKKKRILEALCNRSFNRFEAERLLSDHCLHSTASTIQNQHGIEVCRRFESVPGYMGIKTRVCRYWISPENVEKALKTAKFWR